MPENEVVTVEPAPISMLLVAGVELCAPSMTVQVIVRDGSAPALLASALVEE